MNKQQGFGVIGVLVVIVVLAAIAGSGWLVYERLQPSKGSTASGAEGQSPQSAPSASSTSNVKLEAIMDDGSIQQENVVNFAKTTDQQSVLAAIAARCSGGNNYVVVNNKVFSSSDQPLYAQDGNYAKIDASCGPHANNVDQLSGSGMEMYLSKDQAGIWKIDAQTQMTVDCQSVDGKGYLSSIVTECMADGGTTRAPR